MFIQAKEEKVASTMIPYVAEILSNMFREIEHNNQDRMIESVRQSDYPIVVKLNEIYNNLSNLKKEVIKILIFNTQFFPTHLV